MKETKKQPWKYRWAWNEEYVNCGGQGASSAKQFVKELKNKGIDCQIKIGDSSYVGHTLILIFCKTLKDKKVIQYQLWNNQYVDKKCDEFGWEKIN